MIILLLNYTLSAKVASMASNAIRKVGTGLDLTHAELGQPLDAHVYDREAMGIRVSSLTNNA